MIHKKVIFYDRDGVICPLVSRENRVLSSPKDLSEFTVCDGIEELLQKTRNDGFLNFIITNQPGIARGYLKRENIDEIHKYIMDNLAIDGIFMCPHDDNDNCACRKPRIGMIIQAATKWDINLFCDTFVVGDTWRDMEAAKRSLCNFILIDRPYNKELEPEYRAMNYGQVYKNISKRSKISSN